MIIYWNTHKIPLNPEEVDGNFQYLETELQETKAQLASLRKEIARLETLSMAVHPKVSLSYQHPTLSLSIGEHTTKVLLPMWNFRGVWCDAVAYEPGDIIVYEARIYQCKIANQDKPSAASWEELPLQSILNDQKSE